MSKVTVTWTPPKTDEEKLRDAKDDQRKVINQSRDNAVIAGFTYDFNGTQDVVQTRASDRENIQGLTTTAQLYKSTGNTSTLSFMAQSNTEYQLTPDEMIALGTATMKHKSDQYKKSWTLKDQIESVQITTTLQDAIDQIQSITWS